MRTLYYTFNRCYKFFTAAFLIINLTDLSAQQNIIINKDNTRPEYNRPVQTAFVTTLNTVKHNGYNEIQWSALEKDARHQFFVEYSFDGINFLSAGPVLSNTGIYSYKHYTSDIRPVNYRIRVEASGAAPRYSKPVLLAGTKIPPVRIYSTMVNGNIINVRAAFPVERVTVVSSNGMPVFEKELSGAMDYIPIAIPSLKEGLYFITFYGNNWKSTSQFFYES